MCISMANIFAVPGTGRRAAGHLFRRPHSISVKRQILAVSDSLRGEKVPPDSCDDITIGAYRHRSWKRHRLNQWHEASI